VELPGIEPSPKIPLNCGNIEFYAAKVRERTCGYAEDVDGINRPLTSRRTQVEPPDEVKSRDVVYDVFGWFFDLVI
jgi:hypothetical protein